MSKRGNKAFAETSFTHSTRRKLSRQCTVILEPDWNQPKTEKPAHEDGTFTMLFKLFRYSDKVDTWLIVIGSLAAIVNGMGLPFVAIVMGKITDIFTNVTQNGFDDFNETRYDLYDGNITVNTTDQFTIGGGREDFITFMTEISITYFCMSGITFLLILVQVFCWEMSAERQIHKLRQVFLSQILRQDSGWYDLNTDHTDLSNKLSDDIDRIREGIGCKVSFLIAYLSTFVVGIAIGFYAHVKLTLSLLAMAPIVIGLQAYIARTFVKSSAREQLRYGIAGGIACEVLNCIQLVASFSGEKREIARYTEAVEQGSKLAFVKYYKIAIISFFMNSTTYLAFAVAFRYSAYLIQIDQATPGEVFTVFFSVMAGAFTVSNALPYINMVATAIGSASTIFSVIDRIPNIDPYSSCGKMIENVTGSIEFKNVEFSYPSRPQTQILKGLNMKIESGKRVAIVGPSGSGKSTIVNMILRFYDPKSGMVELDGERLTDLNLCWLRGRIGLVSQEPILFGVSIAENIRWGKDDVTMEDVLRASHLANAHSFIQFLPKGYDTEVGSRGTQLSGGQKQRIAIARALIRDPKILLLDEATSALDSVSESIVQEALDKAMKGRTTVIIAHRLSTIRNADLIITMKEGKVHESGTHEELMALRGLYYSLVMAQLKQKEEEPHISDEDEEEEEEKKEKPVIKPKPLERKKSVVNLVRSWTTRRSRKSSVAPSETPSEAEIDKVTDKQALAEKVSILKIFSLVRDKICYLLLGILGSIILGITMPLFASFYADIFEVFMLNGEEFDAAVSMWTYLFVFLALLTGVSYYTLAMCSCTLTEQIVVKVRERTFTSLLTQDISWFDNPDHFPGRLVSSLARDPPRLKTAAGLRAGQVIVAITTLITSTVISVLSCWKLACCLLSIVPLMFLVNYKEIKVIRKHQERDSKLMDSAGQVCSEAIQSLKTVQALSKEALFLERYTDNLQLPYKEGKQQAIWYSVIYSTCQCLIYIMYAVGFLGGAYFLVEDPDLQPSQIYRTFFALAFCATFVGQATSYVQEFYKAKTSIGFIYGLMEQYKVDGPLSDQGIKPSEISGTIELKGVEFRYPTRREVKILRGLSLKIQSGTTVALVGQSGCGKSTIMGLIKRFYSPTRGKILLDGVDIKQLNLRWLRQQLGVVTQEPVLLASSIKDNIAYGAPDPDNVPMEEIIKAAKTANIHQFVTSLPKGYETEVGDMGAQLSGGQKQRIAIARALIRDPKILLLDEATSALDTESEKMVQEALDLARAGRTCIVIAHRLSTIMNADLIAVIQQGRLIELGNHNQLSQNNGFYAQLVKNSFKT